MFNAKISLLLLSMNFQTYSFRKSKKKKKIVKHVVTFLLSCQVTILYSHSWTENIFLVVEFYPWLISDTSNLGVKHYC